MLLVPKVIWGDHQAVSLISKKIIEDAEAEEKVENIHKSNRDKIRRDFKIQHMANHQWERKLGLVPKSFNDHQQSIR